MKPVRSSVGIVLKIEQEIKTRALAKTRTNKRTGQIKQLGTVQKLKFDYFIHFFIIQRRFGVASNFIGKKNVSL